MVATTGMGLASDRFLVEVVDGIAGMDLVQELGVAGVPTVVLDNRLMLENPAADDSLVDFVVHAADGSRARPHVASVPFRACGRLRD